MAVNSWDGPDAGSFATPGYWLLGHVPTSSEDAKIDFLDAVVTSSADQTVNSIAVGSGNKLQLEGSNIVFNVLNGTGPNVNGGTINVSNSTLQLDNGTFQNRGTIGLQGNNSIVEVTGSLTLNDGGSIEMTIGGGPGSNTITGVALPPTFLPVPTLTNVNNDISGDGTIGGELNFVNQGTIETNNATSSNGGALEIVGSAPDGIIPGSFTNENQVIADNGGTLIFGLDGEPATIVNDDNIFLSGSTKTTKLEIAGNVTIDGDGGIVLGGFVNELVSDGKSASLSIEDQDLQGAGTLGDANLTLNIDSHSFVEALAGRLVLNTGSQTINNAGTFDASKGGILILDSPVNNTGAIDVDSTFNNTPNEIEILGAVSGNGTINIGIGGALAVEAPVSGNVTFSGDGATLYLTPGDLGGNVVGSVPTDAIVFLGAATSGDNAVWRQTSSSGGTLSLYNHGTVLATVNMPGTFNSLDFAVGPDVGTTGTTVTIQSTPSYVENAGDNDEWILSDGNWVESAGPGSHPSGYNVALTGDWTGGGTDGILWFDPTNGDADEWQLSNTQWSASVDLGSHPANSTSGASYQIAGTDGATDFTDDGTDDVLWTSTNSDGTIGTDIWELGSSGKWANSVSPGSHPVGYSIAGTGDWTGSGTDGVLWFNSSTGDTDEWQLSGGLWAASVDLGGHPTNSTDGNSYQIAGIGDFFDNGRDDVLWTSVDSDGTIATDIWELNSSGQWMANVSPGSHPAGYQVVAVGDFTGTGTSDILWYNASTGDTDEWLISNGQWAGSIDLGSHPGNFQIAGVGNFNGDGTSDLLWHASS